MVIDYMQIQELRNRIQELHDVDYCLVSSKLTVRISCFKSWALVSHAGRPESGFFSLLLVHNQVLQSSSSWEVEIQDIFNSVWSPMFFLLVSNAWTSTDRKEVKSSIKSRRMNCSVRWSVLEQLSNGPMNDGIPEFSVILAIIINSTVITSRLRLSPFQLGKYFIWCLLHIFVKWDQAGNKKYGIYAQCPRTVANVLLHKQARGNVDHPL